MVNVGVAELKAHLSEYLARVQDGEEIIVADRGRPVARLVPPPAYEAGNEERRLLDLQRRGLIRVGTGGVPDGFWEIERVPDPTGNVRAAVEADRDENW
jgi:prevent-host-death family protein